MRPAQLLVIKLAAAVAAVVLAVTISLQQCTPIGVTPFSCTTERHVQSPVALGVAIAAAVYAGVQVVRAVRTARLRRKLRRAGIPEQYIRDVVIS